MITADFFPFHKNVIVSNLFYIQLRNYSQEMFPYVCYRLRLEPLTSPILGERRRAAQPLTQKLRIRVNPTTTGNTGQIMLVVSKFIIIRVEDRLMIYLQKIYHESIRFMEMHILSNTFFFYPDLQTFQTETIPFKSPRTNCKLRYKGTKLSTIHPLYLNL